MNLRELIIERETQCKDGEYYCRTSGMCKPIPDGYSVMPDGDLVKEVARVWSRTGGKQTRKYQTKENPGSKAAIFQDEG